MQINIRINNRICVNFFSKEYHDLLKKTFFMKNPKFETLERLGKSTYGTPVYIYFFELTSKGVMFNRGDLNKVIAVTSKFGEINLIDETINGENCQYNWNDNIVLRDYQAQVLEIIKEKDTGTIVMPAGSGKTITGMGIIHKLGKEALWITHTKDLLYQSANACLKCLGIEPGIIGDGKARIGEVTIATVQTLMKRKELLNQLNAGVGVVIVDEAHHVPTSYFSEIIQNFATKKIYGLTATPERKDSMEAYMFSTIGYPLIELNRDALYTDNKLIIPELKQVYTQFIGKCINMEDVSVNLGGDGAEYHELIRQLIQDEERQELIVDTIVKNCDNSRSLVLAEWVEYIEILMEKLKKKLPNKRIEFVYGGTKKDLRAKCLEDFKNDEIDILFATKIAREGLDLPNMDKLFLTTPKRGDEYGTKNGAALEQEVGRVMRTDPKNPNKQATIFDFIDWNNDIFKRQWYSRKQTYERLKIKTKRKEIEKESYLEKTFKGFEGLF